MTLKHLIGAGCAALSLTTFAKPEIAVLYGCNDNFSDYTEGDRKSVV